MSTAPLLDVADLRVSYAAEDGVARAVDGASLHVDAGETLALVGESGCGKTTTALAILGLLPAAGSVDGGAIRSRGEDLLRLPRVEMRRRLGKEIGAIFQDPVAALNPVLRAGDQIAEAVRLHSRASREAARTRAVELLAKVGIADPERVSRAYPHQLSGGMNQRVAIAIAIAGAPSLLVADEPTSALDTTVQAGILALLGALKRESGMGILLVTHDLAVVAETAQRVAVMYAGKIVEEGPVADVLARPRHPYTIALLRSHPARAEPGQRLEPIPGRVPSPRAWPAGCRFHERCPIARERCAREEPPLVQRVGMQPASGGKRTSACHYDEEASKL